MTCEISYFLLIFNDLIICLRDIHLADNLHLSAAVFQKYIQKHSRYIEVISLSECYWISASQLTKALKHCSSLKELNLIGCKLPANNLDIILRQNPHLRKLGWSLLKKSISEEFFNDDGSNTELFNRLQESFSRITCLWLRFDALTNFEILLKLFPKEMMLVELSLEYTGKRSTSIIHSGSDYKVHIASKTPFPGCLENLALNNRFLHFNLMIMDFVTKVVLHAAETDALTVLLAPGSRNSLCWKYIAPSYKTSLLTKIDLSSTCLTAEQMNWLGRLEKLTHLSVQNVQDLKANLMKAIATNCPDLRTLNLNDCGDWIDEVDVLYFQY